MDLVLPFAVFAGFLALLYFTGAWRPDRRRLSFGYTGAFWSRAPMSLFGAAWLLALLGIAGSATAPAWIWNVPLALAGAVLAFVGVGLLANARGWADEFARSTWVDQGFEFSRPEWAARATGAGSIALGVTFVAAAAFGFIG